MNPEKYLLAVIPPQKSIDYIDIFSRQYDPKFESISPHITIYPPFYSKNSESFLIQKLNNNLNSIIPFRVSLNSIDFFTNDNNVAFLKPDLDSTIKLRNLYKNTQLSLSDQVINIWPNYPTNPEQFIPHCTIIRDIPNNELSNIRQKLESLSIYQSFNINLILQD